MIWRCPLYIKKKGPNIYSVHTRDPNWEMDSFLKLTFQIFKVVIDFNSEISTMHMCLVNFRHISFKHYSWMQWLITLFYYSKYYCLTMVENRITIYHFFKCHFILSLLSSCRKGLKKKHSDDQTSQYWEWHEQIYLIGKIFVEAG